MASYSNINHLTPTTVDILKTLKQGFVGSSLEPHKDAKVWLREDGKLVLERPEELWNHHYKRRQENCRCGFFTASWEPYKCLGGPLILDSNELLCDTFSSYLDKKKLKGKVGTTTEANFVHTSDIKNRKDESNTSTIHERTAVVGYNQIRELLKIEDERMVALKAGVPYLDHVKKIEKRMEDKKEKPINGMVLMSTSDFGFMFGQRESVSPGSSDSTDSVDRKQDKSVCSLADDDEMASESLHSSLKSSKSSGSLLRVHSGVTERLERMRRDNIEYLNTIYKVITIMKNIKSKDLKNKQPLTRNQLLDIEKSRRNDREGKLGGVVSHLHKRISTGSTFSMDLSPVTIPSRAETRNNNLVDSKRKNRLLSMFGNQGPLVKIGSRASAMVNDKVSRMLMQSCVRDNRVETWDDLLLAGVTPDGEHDLPAQAMPDNMISKAIKWSRFFSGKHVNEHSILDDKHKPIWQIVANEKPASQFDDSQRNIKSNDPAYIVQRVRRNMDKVKKTLRETCRNEVRKINRDRSCVFQYKLGTFLDMDGTTLFERHMSKMREPKDYGNVDPEMPDVIPSRWLDELTERIYNTVGSDDLELITALSKLRQYSQMEVKNVSLTKAKLCLIVMSMAAYDICKISTQLAIKFILEKIIQCSAEDFYNWLGLRKLPVVILK